MAMTPGRRAAATTALPDPEDKRRAVRVMFDRIASRYDTLNRLLTLGLDQRWRRLALDGAGVRANDLVVDVACGTGDLLEQARARGARGLGVDFSREMLRGAVRRLPGALLLQADAEGLPLPDACADVLTCGFALRNFEHLDAALAEMGRVLDDGGRLALVEVDRPSRAWVAAAHSLYFDRLVPAIGGWLSDPAAYRYLPESTAYLPEVHELRKLLEDRGFEHVERRSFLLGSAQLISARRRPRTA
ncbi:MAG: ubiquinone biosynthesis methyltransferase UbiE [Deltaproteobacteria bacterium]|nr:ubiquinone biosynthesis methyltransferase UbiE [Deltaproteobacteria bacterium]